MFCENCGVEIPDTANFCFKCGTKVSMKLKNETVEDDKSSSSKEDKSIGKEKG